MNKEDVLKYYTWADSIYLKYTNEICVDLIGELMRNENLSVKNVMDILVESYTAKYSNWKNAESIKTWMNEVIKTGKISNDKIDSVIEHSFRLYFKDILLTNIHNILVNTMLTIYNGLTIEEAESVIRDFNIGLFTTLKEIESSIEEYYG